MGADPMVFQFISRRDAYPPAEGTPVATACAARFARGIRPRSGCPSRGGVSPVASGKVERWKSGKVRRSVDCAYSTTPYSTKGVRPYGVRVFEL